MREANFSLVSEFGDPFDDLESFSNFAKEI
jgi:hypothetical protein